MVIKALPERLLSSPKHTISVSGFRELVHKALFNVANLRLYVQGQDEDSLPLTPDYLDQVVVPYLKAVQDLQQIINEMYGRPSTDISIRGITKMSPLGVNIDVGVGDAIQVLQENVVRWRRENSKLLKQIELEQKKADVVATRVRTARDREEIRKLSAETLREQAETERILLENQEKRLALEERRHVLERKRIELALEVIEQLRPRMEEAERISFVVQILEPLGVLTTSELSPAVEP